MPRKTDYDAIERQDAADPAPAGQFWIRNSDGSGRRLTTLAAYRAEIDASKNVARQAFKMSATR